MTSESGLPRLRSLLPIDKIVIGYSLLMCLILLSIGRPLSDYLDELAFYSSMAAVAALLTRIPVTGIGRTAAFFRLGYPALMLTFFYTMTGGTMHLVIDRFLDARLTAFEYSIFGFNPTILIDVHLPNYWITELFSFCYFSYYLMIPMFMLGLFFTRRDRLLSRALATICLTFFSGYLLFFLYPIEGPRWFFSGNYAHDVEGFLFRPMVEFVIANGAVHGGCMPSTHFGVAMVILLYSLKHFRRFAWILLPIDIGMALGTVWGRFHYISDVIVGGIIGLAAYWMVERFHDRWQATGASGVQKEEAVKLYAS